MPRKFLLFIFCAAAIAAPVNPAAELKRTCGRCHNLNVVRAQRLSREEWEQELKKMTSMGARIKDRAALLDYLVLTYGPEKKR